MDARHYDHLEDIIDEFTELATEKYEKGQLEHGGQLWEKQGLIDMAIDEAIDQVIYLLTIKHQLEQRTYE
jgi:hypothetical protein